MSCEVFERQISQAIDHELNDTDAVDLFSHMSGCAGCREFHRSSLKLHTILLKSDDGAYLERATPRGDIRRGVPSATGKPFAFFRRSLTISRLAAAVVLALTIIITATISSVWSAKATGDSIRIEYVSTYPLIDVQEYSLIEKKPQ
ncbi:MAG: hypothetical protein FJ215_11645 [Ignavibacteria bacterium]|nr:hypothetical protein [Ignavibacteria bacterium]